MKQDNKENTAKVCARLLPVSTKQAIEICNFIRGRKVEDAIKLLEKVTEHKTAVPFKRFNMDMGHKRKTGPGRYPEKTSRMIIKLLESVNANAQFKGLNTSNLVIKKVCANKAGTSWHFGRKRRRKMKRTHIEIIAEEQATKEKNVKKTKTRKEIKK